MSLHSVFHYLSALTIRDPLIRAPTVHMGGGYTHQPLESCVWLCAPGELCVPDPVHIHIHIHIAYAYVCTHIHICMHTHMHTVQPYKRLSAESLRLS